MQDKSTKSSLKLPVPHGSLSSPQKKVTLHSPHSDNSFVVHPPTPEPGDAIATDKLPQHHLVLIELLGAAKAESILNPKMIEPVKKQESKKNSKRRKLPVVTTGLGADALWAVLKQQSEQKLKRMDNRIPSDWKTSYGAFLRDNINKNRPIVQRSFTQHADVPELDKLLDRKYQARVRKARHHTNVMYRSSENNKNKTAILLNNNPVPDYTDREGVHSLKRFFNTLNEDAPPSAIDQPTWDQQYEKGLPVIENGENFDEIRKQFSNLRFLTERRSREKGTFYDKYSTADDVKMVTDFPGYRSKLPRHMTARLTVSAPVHDNHPLRSPIDQRPIFNRKSFTAARKEPRWQPLTVGALMEYAPVRTAGGIGDFRFGQATNWRTTTA